MGLSIIEGLNASIILKGDQNQNQRQLREQKMQFYQFNIIDEIKKKHRKLKIITL